MAALSPGYARKAEVEHVKRAYEALLSDVEYLEAEGKLLGSWHTDLWVQERMRPVCEREWQRGRRVAQARMLPLRVRRTAALGVTNPHEELYLEWPRFREALALTVGPAARRIESLPIRLELIPLMPEDEAVSMLRAEWQSLSAAQKVKALWALRFMCGPSVVGFLTRCTSDDEEQSVQTAAYLVLGDIGTSEALRACRGLSLKRGIRGAMRAARAGAGDQETMNELAQVLADSQAEEREAFLSCLLQMHSPSVLRALSVALEFYEREGDAARVAAHLGEMGGCAASSVLARLVEQHGDPYPDAVSQFRGAEMTPLLEPLANILDGEGDAAAVAALLLGASGSDLAVPVLSVAALERHLPEAVVGLAVQGSATALERAAQAADLIGSSELTTISDHWRKRDSAEDADAPWDWRPDVDKTAAAAFLQAVLRKGHDAETKVQAAELLVQIGEKPEPEGLLAVASLSIPAGQPSAKAPAAGGGPPGLGGGPMGLPGGGAFGAGPPMGPGGPMGPFQPGVGLPGQREQLPAERVMDLQKRALELLESVADVDVTSDLRELAESAKSPIGRAGALKILAQVADHETMAYLEELAGPPSGQPRSLEAGQQRLEARAAAIIALAAVGHPEAVTFLADLWFEEPPRLEDFVRRPSAKAYEAALAERGTMVRKAVCQAVLALPTGKTLYSAARDKKQAEALIEAIRAAAENGAVAVATQPSVLEETALAIQSLGRTGRLSARAWATIEALAKEEVPLPEALRSAVADALVAIGTPRADGLLAAMHERMESTAELREHWHEICLRLVARGLDADYRAVIPALGALPNEVLAKAVETMSRRRGLPPGGYYELLAHVVALRTVGSPESPPDFYAKVLASKGEVKEPAPAAPAASPYLPGQPIGPAGMQPGGMPMPRQPARGAAGAGAAGGRNRRHAGQEQEGGPQSRSARRARDCGPACSHWTRVWSRSSFARGVWTCSTRALPGWSPGCCETPPSHSQRTCRSARGLRS